MMKMYRAEMDHRAMTAMAVHSSQSRTVLVKTLPSRRLRSIGLAVPW